MDRKLGPPFAPTRRRPAVTRGKWPRRVLIVVSAIAVTVGLGWAAFAFGVRWVDTASFTDGFPGWSTGHTVGVQDGFVPDGGHLSPHDVELPAIANLDPKLLHAVQEAADDAAEDGIHMFLTTGWRSKAYQQRLLDEAVVKYGSEREARRYVGTPEQSHHVTGEAVDIGPTDADSWLSQHGTDYGLCQTYGNEMWHFELATTPGGVCPEMLPDASDGRPAPTE
jgi:zinc D-Ala-D-Ala carboxypeptidase